MEEWKGEGKGGERREMGGEGMLALRRGTCCRRRRGDVGGRGTVGGTGKWWGARQGGEGVALNTDECLKRRGATCNKEECHTIKTQDTQATSLHAHTSFEIPGEYAREVWLPSLWRSRVTPARNTHVCLHGPAGVPASVHIDTHACFFFFISFAYIEKMHQQTAQPLLQTWQRAKNVTRGVPGNACIPVCKHRHTHTGWTRWLCFFIYIHWFRFFVLVWRKCFYFSVRFHSCCIHTVSADCSTFFVT